MQYMEPVSEWSCWRMFIETWPHSELNPGNVHLNNLKSSILNVLKNQITKNEEKCGRKWSEVMRSKCDYEAGWSGDEVGFWVRESSQILRLDRTMALCQSVPDVLPLLRCRSSSVAMKDNTWTTSLLYSEWQFVDIFGKIILLHLNIFLQISK